MKLTRRRFISFDLHKIVLVIQVSESYDTRTSTHIVVQKCKIQPGKLSKSTKIKIIKIDYQDYQDDQNIHSNLICPELIFKFCEITDSGVTFVEMENVSLSPASSLGGTSWLLCQTGALGSHRLHQREHLIGY